MTVKLCKKCVRNINSPFIQSTDDVCQHCEKFESHKEHLLGNLKKIKGKFTDELKKSKGPGRYDCLVMVSGGKDSISALLQCWQVKKERVLAYTVDNGFESDEALNNIKNAVEKLNIDWILDKPGQIKGTLRTLVKNKAKISICRFCSGMIVNRGIKMAIDLKIPVMITGWNKGQSDREPSRFPLWKITDEEIAKSLGHSKITNLGLLNDENVQLLVKNKIKVLSPWIFDERDNDRNIELIKKELGWKITPTSYPRKSTSCLLNFLQVVLSRKNFGFTHYDCEESMLINYDEKTRREAIKTLNQDIDKEVIDEVLRRFNLRLKDVGLTPGELKKFSKFYFE